MMERNKKQVFELCLAWSDTGIFISSPQLIAMWLQIHRAKDIALHTGPIGWLAKHVTVYCAFILSHFKLYY